MYYQAEATYLHNIMHYASKYKMMLAILKLVHSYTVVKPRLDQEQTRSSRAWKYSMTTLTCGSHQLTPPQKQLPQDWSSMASRVPPQT